MAKKTSPKKSPAKAAEKKLEKATTRRLKALTDESEESTALDTLYVVDGSDHEVALEVLLGDKGQSFDLSILLDGNDIADHIKSNFPETEIGTNKNLDGKVLHIAASIMDMSKETNLTSLTITLTGGKEDREFPLQKSVDEEGGEVTYACRIEFFKP